LAGTYPSTRAEQLSYWQGMIDWTRRYYKPVFDASQKLINLYNMEPVNQREATEESFNAIDGPGARVKSNIVFGWVDQSISNIAASNPHFRTVATNEQGVGSDRSVSRISDYWYRETGQLETDRQVLLDAFLGPFGAVKIGWESEIENEAYNLANASPGEYIYETPQDETNAILSGISPVVLPPQDHALFIASHVAAQQDPLVSESIKQLLEINIQERKRLLDEGNPSYDSTIKHDSPFGQHWFMGDALLDPLARMGLRDARFVAWRWQRPIDEILSDGNLFTKGLEPNAKAFDQKADLLIPNTQPKHGQLDMVEGYEIWVKNFPVSVGRKRDLLINIAPGFDDFLRYDRDWETRDPLSDQKP